MGEILNMSGRPQVSKKNIYTRSDLLVWNEQKNDLRGIDRLPHFLYKINEARIEEFNRLNLENIALTIQHLSELQKKHLVLDEQGVAKQDEQGNYLFQEGKNKEDYDKLIAEYLSEQIEVRWI